MKITSKILVVLFAFALVSCVDKKKEEAEVNAAVEQIEAVEDAIQEVGKEIDTKVNEVEESLKELDSI
jgi:hypothetical protein